jgi:hypothetical protein
MSPKRYKMKKKRETSKRTDLKTTTQNSQNRRRHDSKARFCFEHTGEYLSVLLLLLNICITKQKAKKNLDPFLLLFQFQIMVLMTMITKKSTFGIFAMAIVLLFH